MKVQLREREGEAVCVYCRERIDGEVRTCSGCQVSVHLASMLALFNLKVR